ncbi:hypothetical protein NQ315_001018 [Exocentrus adspersus]|uniref:Uncharacterized protein n=1 Tax=Exocentrus adspersus TaxID=1586481 RepID=A0AAV8WE44_9CUCU|nr:hypothetical protein NQ315_001018 [Exocentrus adspersus]
MHELNMRRNGVGVLLALLLVFCKVLLAAPKFNTFYAFRAPDNFFSGEISNIITDIAYVGRGGYSDSTSELIS